MKDYFITIKQLIQINEHYSEGLVVKTGIPQGTIFGPLLYILFVNELLDKYIKGTIISQSDDTGIKLQEKQYDKLELLANETLDNIADWLRENGMFLNLKKTSMISENYVDSMPKRLKIVVSYNYCIVIPLK